MVNLESSPTYVLVVTRKENQMAGILLLLVIFGGFGYAFYLLVTEGLGGQLSKIEQTQARINEHHRKENK